MTEADSVHSTPPSSSSASNVIDLSARRAATALSPENVRSFESSVRPAQLPITGHGRRRSAASMHTYVFRSYDLIVASPEADLVRDVRCDVDKASSMLNSIRGQIRRDREHAVAGESLLTKAEADLPWRGCHATQTATFRNRPIC